MKHMQNLDWKLYFPLFGYAIKKRMFVDFLISYIGPPKCVHYLL